MKHSREIRDIALPAIVSNITTPILGLVDVAVTGHIGAAVYIGAIALGGTVFNILYWLFNFLRMGTSGPTAQAYGAADRRGTVLMLWRSLAVALAVGMLLFALGRPCGRHVLAFMDADDATLALASHYFAICIYGAPAVMVTYALNGWFIGVALGTTVAQWFGAFMGLIIVFVKYRPHMEPFSEIFRKDRLLAFFRINTDIFFRTACLVAVTLWFTHAGARQGVDILAANALLLQLFMLFSFFMDGFAFAGEALAGKYHGRGDSASLRTLIRSLAVIGLACAVIFAALYAFIGEWFMRMLAEDPNVVDTARRYLPWAVAVPVCGFLAFIWDGIFIGLTRTRAMLWSMLIAMLVFFALYFFLSPLYANDALWFAFCVYLAVRGVAESLFYRFPFRRRRLSK